VAFLSRLAVMKPVIHDLTAEVLAWSTDQLTKSAAEESWLAVQPTIFPVQGQPVAGFMIFVWCKSPVLGDAHMSEGTIISGVPDESAIRQVVRDMIAKLREKKSAIMAIPAPPKLTSVNGFNPNIRGFTK
jgi:hypothetical protein